jgi:hypothetical protein
MNLHLQEISTHVSPGAFAVLTLECTRRGIACASLTTSGCSIYHLTRPNQTRSKTLGVPPPTTISAIVSMQPTRRLWTPIVSPGTNSSPHPHVSDRSPLANLPEWSTHESLGIRRFISTLIWIAGMGSYPGSPPAAACRIRREIRRSNQRFPGLVSDQ